MSYFHFKRETTVDSNQLELTRGIRNRLSYRGLSIGESHNLKIFWNKTICLDFMACIRLQIIFSYQKLNVAFYCICILLFHIIRYSLKKLHHCLSKIKKKRLKFSSVAIAICASFILGLITESPSTRFRRYLRCP